MWTLDPDSELNAVTPWLGTNPSDNDRWFVAEHLYGLLHDPYRPALEGPAGVFSVVVPGTSVTMIWTYDTGPRVVFVLHLAS